MGRDHHVIVVGHMQVVLVPIIYAVFLMLLVVVVATRHRSTTYAAASCRVDVELDAVDRLDAVEHARFEREVAHVQGVLRIFVVPLLLLRLGLAVFAGAEHHFLVERVDGVGLWLHTTTADTHLRRLYAAGRVGRVVLDSLRARVDEAMQLLLKLCV